MYLQIILEKLLFSPPFFSNHHQSLARLLGMPPPARPASRTLVTLIDGDCALCSGYARLVSWADTRGLVYFETQQSAVGKQVLRRARQPLDLSTIVLVEHANGEITGWTKSTAVLRMFQALGGAWSVVGVLGMVVPKVIRDAIYTFIAKHRIKIFGTNGGRCKLPDAVIRKRISRALPKELLGE